MSPGLYMKWENHKWSKTYFQRKTMTHKVATKGESGSVECTQIQNEEICFYRIVLSGTILNAVAEAYSQNFFF